jgi:hypothetical protein
MVDTSILTSEKVLDSEYRRLGVWFVARFLLIFYSKKWELSVMMDWLFQLGHLSNSKSIMV